MCSLFPMMMYPTVTLMKTVSTHHSDTATQDKSHHNKYGIVNELYEQKKKVHEDVGYG